VDGGSGRRKGRRAAGPGPRSSRRRSAEGAAHGSSKSCCLKRTDQQEGKVPAFQEDWDVAAFFGGAQAYSCGEEGKDLERETTHIVGRESSWKLGTCHVEEEGEGGLRH